MIVMKFGGSSLASAKKIRRVQSLVEKQSGRDPIVVVSAHGKTTNQLIEAANRALVGVIDFDGIKTYHQALTGELGVSFDLVAPLFDSLSTLLQGVSLLRELTLRTLDHIMSFGERISTRIVAEVLTVAGLRAIPVNAFEVGLTTTKEHGRATPLPGIDETLRLGLSRMEGIPVVTGFLGSDSSGHITTLGRSGSDFSASIVGAACGVEEVQIWTDVNGVMTCDPSVDCAAQNLPKMSFDEASELAYYGAQVLHPNTLLPVIAKGIPVRVLNTMRPEDPGTVIVNEEIRTSRLAKSVVYKEDVSLITIFSARLMSSVRLLSSALDIFSECQVGIHLANTSEATVSLVTDGPYDCGELETAILKLEKLGRVLVEKQKAIICVVGQELRGRAGVLGSIFGAISSRGIKAKMVSQSASEINVSFLVENEQVEDAVKALHKLII